MKKLLVLILSLLPAIAGAQALDPSEFKSIRRVTALPAVARIGELYILLNSLTADPSLHIYTSTGFVELAQTDSVSSMTITTLTVTTITGPAAANFNHTSLQGHIFNIGNAYNLALDDPDAAGNIWNVVDDVGELIYQQNITVAEGLTTFAATSNHILLGGTAGGVEEAIDTITNGNYNGDSGTLNIIIECADTNITLNDAGAGGAANTMNLAGGVLACAEDTVIELMFVISPATGNARWVEVGRSVN